MYPNLYYAFRDLFGIDWPALRFINSFGFFVALAFILGAVILAAELRRKSRQGLLQPTEVQVMVGKPATISELLINFLLGFLLGYKILALFLLNKAATDDPQAFIFSSRGSWPAGIILGLLFAGLKWWDRKKQVLPKPEQRKIRIWPQDRVGEITIIALVFGLLGAKLFDIFENWTDFLKNPSAYIFSPAGLTFYGGLIFAGIAIIWYARRHKIGVHHLSDAMAPTLILAYAVGRIGCQVSGDGDWGIYNSAYTLGDSIHVKTANYEEFQRGLEANQAYFSSQYGSTAEVPHASFSKPGFLEFLPDWMFAYNYPHNVNEAGIPIPGCTDAKYCMQLPGGVFPTPFYETIVCLILFLVLWTLRKRFKIPGTLFALYLILNGLERFFIEKIRVNTRMNIFGFQPTQAEVISTLLVISGVILWIYLRRKTTVTMKI